MKIGFISDTHIRSFQKNSSFLVHIQKAFDYFAELCQEKGVEHIIHGGDVFHLKDMVAAEALIASMFDIVGPLQTIKPMTMLVGNHDTLQYDNHDINLVKVFEPYPNVTVVEKYHYQDIPGSRLHFLPYLSEHRFIEALDNIQWGTEKNYLIGHVGVESFYMQADGYTDKYSKVTVDLFKRFDYVFLGHFHFYQTQKNVSYISSPFECRHGDEDGKHGFVFFDTETGEHEFVENHYSPKYKTIILDDETLKELGKYKNHFLRIVVKKSINTEILRQLKTKLEKNNYQVKFDYDIQISDAKIAKIEDWETIVVEEADDTLISFLDHLEKIGQLPYSKNELIEVIGAA